MIVTTLESSRMVDAPTKNAQTAGVGTNQNRERIVASLDRKCLGAEGWGEDVQPEPRHFR